MSTSPAHGWLMYLSSDTQHYMEDYRRILMPERHSRPYNFARGCIWIYETVAMDLTAEVR